MRLPFFGQKPEPVPPPPPVLTSSSGALNLDDALLNFSGDPFRIRDACEGVQVFGAIGSGKTSGSGRALALSYLASGFGGLVLCAKPDERALWEKLAIETGREDDLVIFDASGDRYRFNFLDYERNHAGNAVGLTANVVQMLAEVVRAIDREEKEQGEKPFWKNALRQLTTAAIELAGFADLPLRFDALSEIVRSGPENSQQLSDPDWQKQSACYACIEYGEAHAATRDKYAEADFQRCRSYWTSDFARLNAETRASIVLSFTMVLDLFNAQPLSKLLSDETTITPEDTFEGKIIVMDLPLQVYYRAGRIAQFIFKYCWQRAVLRRPVGPNTMPAFLWADESQNFISDFDPEFQAVARSQRACTVYLSQNIGMYKKALGEGSDNAVEAFLGNLQTKIFHQNSSTETNQWAADLFAKDWITKKSTNTGYSTGGASGGQTTSKELHHQVNPIEFTRLTKGGPQNNFIVEGVMYKGGTTFRQTNANFLKVLFSQK